MQKVGDAEVKASFQPPFYVREINSKCPKGYCLLVKKDKDDANRENHDESSSRDKEKAKSHNLSSIN